LPEGIAVPQQEYAMAKDNLAKLIRIEYRPSEYNTHFNQARYWEMRRKDEHWIHQAMAGAKVAVSQRESSGNQEGIFKPSGGDRLRDASGLPRDDGLGGFTRLSEESEPEETTQSDTGKNGYDTEHTVGSKPRNCVAIIQGLIAAIDTGHTANVAAHGRCPIEPLPSLPNPAATRMPLPTTMPPKVKGEVMQQWAIVAGSMLGTILGFAVCYYTLVPGQ
jgi:hypothetical protein